MDIDIDVVPTDDNRSYHVSSDLMRKELGFLPTRTVEDAVRDLKQAFDSGKVVNPMTSPLYYNIRRMQGINLS